MLYFVSEYDIVSVAVLVSFKLYICFILYLSLYCSVILSLQSLPNVLIL